LMVDPFTVFRRSVIATAADIPHDPASPKCLKKTRPFRRDVKRSLFLPEVLDGDRRRSCSCEDRNCPSKLTEGKRTIYLLRPNRMNVVNRLQRLSFRSGKTFHG
jgi:hypothetical protein